jgi:hypothetical protein
MTDKLKHLGVRTFTGLVFGYPSVKVHATYCAKRRRQTLHSMRGCSWLNDQTFQNLKFCRLFPSFLLSSLFTAIVLVFLLSSGLSLVSVS